MNVRGATVLVTGANRGIGAAYARAFLDAGAAKVYGAARDTRPSPTARSAVIPPIEAPTRAGGLALISSSTATRSSTIWSRS